MKKHLFAALGVVTTLGLALSVALAQTKSPGFSGPAPKSDMVQIPAGWFQMGCSPGDSECDKDEKPRKRVYVDAFYMDVHEVTVAEYRRCVNAGACKAAKVSSDKKWGPYYNWDKSGRDAHPVNGVSWHNAESYCRWKGKQLPTETQFERALRGGSDGRIYPWGNSSNPPAQYGNYSDESARRRFPEWTIFDGYDDGYVGTSPVCSMRKSSYGLCDISGNVWEWSRDWYDKDWYGRMPERNPTNRTKATSRVLRGGCWIANPRNVRASYRFRFEPSNRLNNIGFRCSRD